MGCKKFKQIFIFSLVLSVHFFLYSQEYFSLNSIIDHLDLVAEYNNRLNNMYIHKNENSVLIMNFCNYILINGEKHFIPDFVVVQNGKIMLPLDTAIEILNLFSQDKKLTILNEEIIEVNVNSDEKQKITERYYVYNPNKNSEKQQKTTKKEQNNTTENKNNANSDNYVVKHSNSVDAINTIVIDPGHGGTDPGAVGYNDIQEKEIVLSVSLMVQKKLKQIFPNKKIIITRDKDTYISLEERAQIANKSYSKYGKALFVSIHVNSSRAKNSFGFETWYLTSDYKRDVVDKSKISDDENVAEIVNLMVNEEIYNQSKILAKKIQDQMEKYIGYVSKNRGIKEETYFVIKKSIMPAVLVEIGFNSNKYEAIRLTNYTYRTKIRDAICDGIRDYISITEKK